MMDISGSRKDHIWLGSFKQIVMYREWSSLCTTRGRVNHHERNCIKNPPPSENYSEQEATTIKSNAGQTVAKKISDNWIQPKQKPSRETSLGLGSTQKIWIKKSKTDNSKAAKENEGNSFTALNDTYAINILEGCRENLPNDAPLVTSPCSQPSKRENPLTHHFDLIPEGSTSSVTIPPPPLPLNTSKTHFVFGYSKFSFQSFSLS